VVPQRVDKHNSSFFGFSEVKTHAQDIDGLYTSPPVITASSLENHNLLINQFPAAKTKEGPNWAFRLESDRLVGSWDYTMSQSERSSSF
jgi:hypothetical protein